MKFTDPSHKKIWNSKLNFPQWLGNETRTRTRKPNSNLWIGLRTLRGSPLFVFSLALSSDDELEDSINLGHRVGNWKLERRVWAKWQVFFHNLISVLFKILNFAAELFCKLHFAAFYFYKNLVLHNLLLRVYLVTSLFSDFCFCFKILYKNGNKSCLVRCQLSTYPKKISNLLFVSTISYILSQWLMLIWFFRSFFVKLVKEIDNV